LALLLSVLVLAPPSSAQQPLTYDLDYVADAGCPERATFTALVQAQLDEAHEPRPLARAHASVSLRRHASGATARFELLRDDGTHYWRELAGESCDEAAQGLAFVLAYALGGGDPENSPSPEIAPKNAAPEPAPEARKEAPAPVTATPEPAPPAPASVSNARRSRWRFGFGVQLGARTGLGPIWTPVESGLVEARLSGDSVVAPALRAAVVHAEPITRIDRFGSSEFSWLAARLEACPLQLVVVAQLRLLPCVGTHLGQITAAGQPNSEANASGRRADQLWVDALGAVRLELSLLRVLLVEAQGDLLVPLTPYRFAFDNPDTSVYQVPSLALAGFVGLGAHFP
jgi:hypothetical protein